ncbi:MAG: glycosyltransferase family 2 protein [Candidatus Sumerlaeota bacterium]|nr:glycosyltransferase family 2 protein [Candidatus Sumerlaeota bacterium]
MAEPTPRISIIVPLKNEARSVAQLVDETRAALARVAEPYEIVLVDDGSTDGTWATIRTMAEADPRVIGIRFRKNLGQTAALSAGFDYSRGDVIFPMDGDLQNDPADIPRLLAKLEEGYDVVSGWRRSRRDPLLMRVAPSWLANKLVSLVGGVKLHDFGCTLKAYRRDVVKDVRLYGEMHRFIPIYASWHGALTAEIEVNHRARVHGRSNYGFGRMFKVVLDLIVIKFLADFLQKPIYVFGGMALLSLFGALMAGLYAVYLKLRHNISFILTPLPLLTVLLIVLAVNAVLIGLVAEISVRIYYEAQQKKTYVVRETLNTTLKQ